MTSFYDLVESNRTCRRFYQDENIDFEILEYLVNLARLSASAGNLQPLKYFITNSEEINEKIFSCIAWAAYLKDWPGPEIGERPSAYIIVTGDTSIAKNFGCDHGIASQTILLGAREKNIAGCMIGAFKKNQLMSLLNIPSKFEILLVIALGKPKEKVTIETIEKDGDIKYFRDQHLVHHVPKRKLEDIIFNLNVE